MRRISGIELPGPGCFGQVARIALERIIALLGGGGVGGAAFSQRIDRFVQFDGSDAGFCEDFRRGRFGLDGERCQQALGGDELVLRFLGEVFGRREYFRHAGAHIKLAAALDLREARERKLDRPQSVVRPSASGSNKIGGEALAIVEERLEDMFWGELLVVLANGYALRRLDETLGAVRVVLELHEDLRMSIPETARPVPATRRRLIHGKPRGRRKVRACRRSALIAGRRRPA